jgi:hypothetical protein
MLAKLAGKGRNLNQIRHLGVVQSFVDLARAELGLVGTEHLPDLAKFHA